MGLVQKFFTWKYLGSMLTGTVIIFETNMTRGADSFESEEVRAICVAANFDPSESVLFGGKFIKCVIR